MEQQTNIITHRQNFLASNPANKESYKPIGRIMPMSAATVMQQTSLNSESQNSHSASTSTSTTANTAGPPSNAPNPSANRLKPSTESPADSATSALHVPAIPVNSSSSSQSPSNPSQNQLPPQNDFPNQQPSGIPQPNTPPRDTSGSPQVESLHQQLGGRPTTNRRLTIDAGFARPSLLKNQLQHKSSSAVPTLSSTVAVGGSITPTTQASSLLTVGARRASSASTRISKLGNMAGRDVSATDLLKQAMMHRYVLTAHFLVIGPIF